MSILDEVTGVTREEYDLTAKLRVNVEQTKINMLVVSNHSLLIEIIAYLCKRDNIDYKQFKNIINNEV